MVLVSHDRALLLRHLRSFRAGRWRPHPALRRRPRRLPRLARQPPRSRRGRLPDQAADKAARKADRARRRRPPGAPGGASAAGEGARADRQAHGGVEQEKAELDAPLADPARQHRPAGGEVPALNKRQAELAGAHRGGRRLAGAARGAGGDPGGLRGRIPLRAWRRSCAGRRACRPTSVNPVRRVQLPGWRSPCYRRDAVLRVAQVEVCRCQCVAIGVKHHRHLRRDSVCRGSAPARPQGACFRAAPANGG